MKAIGECIPFDDPKLPILHHVVKDAPQFMNDFAFRYPSAGYLRDEQERSLHQAYIVSGTKTYKNNAMFFLRMRDEETLGRLIKQQIYIRSWCWLQIRLATCLQ
jgi:hypothetical protein